MTQETLTEGQTYLQKTGMLKIIKYHSARKIDIEFIDTGTRLVVNAQQIRKKTIEDKMAPNPKLFGVGYHGVGPHKITIKSKLTKPYRLWYDMLCRCYNKTLHTTKHANYANVTVCKEWHNFQNFADWLEKNYVEGWELDKDLIGSKVYSPSTCIYIPPTVNMTEAYLRKLQTEDSTYKTVYEDFVAITILKYKQE